MFSESTNSAKWDLPVFKGKSKPYIIASTPRSGSTFLGSLLWATHLAGAPHEYFHPSHAADFYNRWNCRNTKDYVKHLIKFRTSPNGVTGIKLHHYQMKEFGITLEEILNYFDQPSFIFIRRQTKVRQAISLYKAVETGQFSLKDGEERKETVYNFDEIRRHFFRLIEEENRWTSVLEEAGIEPLTVWYEELEADYTEVLNKVFTFLSEDKSKIPPPSPTLRKQSDETTEIWVQQFHKEFEEYKKTL